VGDHQRIPAVVCFAFLVHFLFAFENYTRFLITVAPSSFFFWAENLEMGIAEETAEGLGIRRRCRLAGDQPSPGSLLIL
jgi:hypothetical protein